MKNSISQYTKFYFIGIAGTGMSAIAQYLKGTGVDVAGSDRLFAPGTEQLIKQQFESQGILCFNQDGSGLTRDVSVVVISTAIEDSNSELVKAREMGIPVMKRSELLAAISSGKKTIAVGGTSGKSTTTAMIFHILEQTGHQPSLMTGAGLSSLQRRGLPGNAWVGNGEWLVIESDESDGSIVNYVPEVSVVLNIDRDHKELDELVQLFTTFKNNTRKNFIVNNDFEITRSLGQNSDFDFGVNTKSPVQGSNYTQEGFNISFNINNIPFSIPVPGRHNMENAMAASAVALSIGISLDKSAMALTTYEGIYRRSQLVGKQRGVYVVDDFAHNPAEVSAAIKSCQNISNRVIAWFQPHGFGPLKFMYNELVHEVCETLRSTDLFYITDVYYAGGTVNKEITSDMVINEMKHRCSNVNYMAHRDELLPLWKLEAKDGDIILLMGARDTTMSDFALKVLENL